MRKLALALLAAAVLAHQQAQGAFEGAVAQVVDVHGRNVTLFAAGFFETPGKPPEAGGAKWVPGPRRNLCSVSTFLELASSEGEGEEEKSGSGNGSEEGYDDRSEQRADTNDCLPFYHWTSTHHGHWIIPQHNLRSSPLLVHGSCAVTASVRREWRGKLPWGVAVSSEDVRRVLGEVLGKYEDAGRVGGWGGMGCLGWGIWEPLAVPVDWRVGGWVRG